MKQRSKRIWALTLCLCLTLPCLLWLTGCHTESVDQSAITSVTLSGDTLTVEAALTDDFLLSSGDKKPTVYLFELPSHIGVDEDISGLRPVAEEKAASRLHFTLPVTDGMRSRLYSSYLVASYDSATKRYTPLTTPMALQNPEVLATVSSSYIPSGSLKGLANAAPTDAVRLGVAHAIVDVNIDALMLDGWTEGATAYLWNGTTAYLDGETLAALDAAVSTYAASGVQVYLRLRLMGRENPENPAFTVNGNRAATVDEPRKTATKNDGFSLIPPAGLAVTGAAPDRAGYAVDMTSPEVAVRMEGLLDHLAARYTAMTSASAPTVAFIVGYRANDPAYADAGNLDPEAALTNYEKLVRMAHIALRTHATDGRVYIAVDDRRTVAPTTDSTVGEDVSRFISAFAEEAALRGDYDWHVAAELYAESSRLWEETTEVDDRYTVRTLGTLADLLRGGRYLTGAGEARRLLISGFSVPATDKTGALTDAAATDQAASYAFAYLTARCTGGVEALIWNAYTDATTPAHGLWSTDKTGAATRARPVYEVLRKIDTSAAATLGGGLTALIGAPYTKLTSALAGYSDAVTLIEADGHVSEPSASHGGASPLFTFDHGSQNGFVGADNLTFAELAASEYPERLYLHARFDRQSKSEPMLLSVTIPATALIGGRELSLDLFAGTMDSLPVDTSLTLRITRAAIGNPADGDGALLYEATVSGLDKAAWKTATFPIGDLTRRLKAGETVTLTLLLDAPAGDTFELGLSGLYVTGMIAGATVPTTAVVVIVIVIALLVAATVVYLNIRHRRQTISEPPTHSAE